MGLPHRAAGKILRMLREIILCVRIKVPGRPWPVQCGYLGCLESGGVPEQATEAQTATIGCQHRVNASQGATKEAAHPPPLQLPCGEGRGRITAGESLFPVITGLLGLLGQLVRG